MYIGYTMVDITRLLCGKLTAADALRYGGHSARMPSHMLRFSKDRKPIVVWNSTRRCNLRCVHCYAQAGDRAFEGEFTTEEGRAFIDDLAEMGVPVLLFSGGEPFLREDLFELGAYARSRGLRAVISTNGTLISPEMARKVKDTDFQYVGISLDGMEATNDRFRGKQGAFQEGLQGIRNCKEVGVKVGLRFTLNRRNMADLDAIFDLMIEEEIPRCCIYHLVYAGRGTNLTDEDLSHEETRDAVDLIFRRTREIVESGREVEILTVDNHSDGPYLYMQVLREDPSRAEEIMRLLRMNGGNGSGERIGAVDWRGDVHADQFWTHYSFGNLRDRPFSEIWYDTSDELMRGLKEKKEHVKGRCARCRFLDICGGNFRVRAEAVHDDVWAPDPACYLTDEEIGVADAETR